MSEAPRSWLLRSNAWADLHPVVATLIVTVAGFAVGALVFGNLWTAFSLARAAGIGLIVGLGLQRWHRRHDRPA